jgi:pimeloyl-ACP methyl ester carboxylesterase
VKAKSRRFQINGLKLQFYFWGNPKNPPLFLLHGWLDTGAGFHFLCEHLTDRFYCIAPDMRGYGKSQHTSNPLGYFFFDYLADLHAILKKFSPRKKVALLGHSLGGVVASVYAGTFPERVAHLINVEGFAFQRPEWKSPPLRLRRWLEEAKVKRFRRYRDCAHFVRRLAQTYPRVPKARLEFLAKYLGEPTKKGFRMAADPKHKIPEPYSFSSEHLFSFWQQIQAPCLFVSAEHTEMENFFPGGGYRRELRKQGRHFPKACRYRVISGSGHMVHYEKPEALAALLKNFF